MICDPAQAGAAKAVAESVSNGIIPKAAAEDLIVISKFLVHPSAVIRHRGYVKNYKSMQHAKRKVWNADPRSKSLGKTRKGLDIRSNTPTMDIEFP